MGREWDRYWFSLGYHIPVSSGMNYCIEIVKYCTGRCVENGIDTGTL